MEFVVAQLRVLRRGTGREGEQPSRRGGGGEGGERVMGCNESGGKEGEKKMRDRGKKERRGFAGLCLLTATGPFEG